MNELLLDMFYWVIFLGFGIIFVIYCIRLGVTRYKRDSAKQNDLNDEGISQDRPEYTTVSVRATVVDQTCCVKTVGIRIPKTIKEFTITFKTENGDIVSLNVPEEMYDAFDKDQTGILTLVDGQLYGFELLNDSIN